MKKSIFAKMLVLVLAIVTVFAFATTAFAVYDEYMYQRNVFGGASQWQTGGYYRTEPNTMDVYPIAITWRGESGWKYRGYIDGTGTASTAVKQMYDTEYYTAAYTTGTYTYMNMKMSIASANVSDYLTYSGYLYF
jgi:hypothetical protein